MARYFLALMLGGLLIGATVRPSVAATVFADEYGTVDSAVEFGPNATTGGSRGSLLMHLDETTVLSADAFALSGDGQVGTGPLASVTLPKPNVDLPTRDDVVDASVDAASLIQEQESAAEGAALQDAQLDATQSLLWKGMLLLLPAIGGVFVAFDFRGNRRNGRKDHVETIKLYESAPAPRRRNVPAALAALGLDADCTEEDVKRAYRERAKSAHPDHGGDARQFIELQRNFEESLRLVRSNAARNAFQARPASRRAA